MTSRPSEVGVQVEQKSSLPIHKKEMEAFCSTQFPLNHGTLRTSLSNSKNSLTPLNSRSQHRPASIARQNRHTPISCKVSSEPPNPLKILACAVASLVVSTTPFLPMFSAQPAEAKPPFTSAPLRFQQSMLQDDDEAPSKLNAQWDVKSINSETETFLMFSNDSNSVVDLWWIDYFGHEVYYASINPGTTHMQPSYATHPWVVRDHISQNSVLVLVAEARPALAIVDNDNV